MNAPLKLAPKPKPDADVQERIVALLRRTLDEAERGEFVSVIMILSRPDGTWAERFSATLSVSEIVGRVTIALQGWVNDFLRDSVIES